MKRYRIVLLSLTALTAFGCSPTHKAKPAQGAILQIKGDPMNFVAGRTLHPKSTIPADLVDPSVRFQIAMQGYENVVDPATVTPQARKKMAEPAPERPDFSNLADGFYSFRKSPDNVGDYELSTKSGGGTAFRFNKYGSHLELIAIVQNGKSMLETSGAYTLLNYSSTPDASKHSILIFSKGPKSHVLIAYTLIQAVAEQAHVSIADEIYNYMFGAGAKVGWNVESPISVLFCTKEAPQFLHDDFLEQVNEWRNALSGRLQLETEREDSCPSFDDVNTRTFGFVQGWVEIPGPQAGVFGVTHVAADLTRGEFVDGDIFIFAQELQELLDAATPGRKVFDSESNMALNFRNMIKRVVKHELGHFLGLHHQFVVPSIMSYDWSVQSLRTYDTEAIHALYPLMIPH